MRFSVIFTGVCITLLLSACGADAERVSAISGLTGDVTAGKFLYDRDCARCHGPAGAGTALGDDIRGVDKTSAIEITLTGEDDMPPYDFWEDQEIADCIAYVLEF